MIKTVPVPLWWLCRVRHCLNNLMLPSGLAGDVIFLLREQFTDLINKGKPMSAEKITVHGIDEAAKMVRNMAELTAKNSQNWDAFEALTKDILKQTYEAGISKGQEA